ncbi:MAG: putative daunorubicin resistance transporter, ATP-binding subunit [Myxococcales bacterium]|nr:putative daunorubicin resistance transporter, ATP-binding subunit [Myxococcales bacterium]
MADAGFLRLEGLTRRFGERVAVDRLTVDIARGEVFGFLGPNGAGKSTTFHLLTGLLAPDAGRVLLEGIEAPPTDGRVRRRLGVVFQDPSLDDKLTALENLKLGAALYGLTGRRADARIAELLGLVELGDRAKEPVERYSGGMKRRLEIARVLLHEPEILVMDEPSRGIDAPTQRRIWEQLLELRRTRRMTILLTTHQPEEAEYCDRLAVLDHGRVIACDTPEQLRREVGGDVVILDGDGPEELAAEVRARFGFEPRLVDGTIVIETPRGHELIPRLVEALPPGRLRSVSMRRPTLADVFVHLTGRGLN